MQTIPGSNPVGLSFFVMDIVKMMYLFFFAFEVVHFSKNIERCLLKHKLTAILRYKVQITCWHLYLVICKYVRLFDRRERGHFKKRCSEVLYFESFNGALNRSAQLKRIFQQRHTF